MRKRLLIATIMSLLALTAVFMLTACGEHVHEWGEWTTVTQPGCTTEGTKERTCSGCDEKETETIPPVGHKPGEYLSDETSHWRICSVCNEKTDVAAHSFGHDNKCITCGYTISFSDGLSYALQPDGNAYTVTGTGTFAGDDLVVPAFHNNLPVRAIGSYAFETETITSVKFIGNLSRIEPYAFSGCESLTAADLGKDLEYIGDEAFDGCTSLYSVKLGGSLDYIGQYAFESCDKLVEVYDFSKNGDITAGERNYGYVAFRALAVHSFETDESCITTEGDFVFMMTESGASLIDYTGSNTSVTLPANLKGESYAVNARAFFGRTDIATVTLGGVNEIGEKAFYGSGITSLVIPAGLHKIGESAFAHCADLASVDLGGAKEIGKYAFEYTGLTEVFIPSAVNVMGDYVFAGNNLSSIKCQHSAKPDDWAEYWYWYSEVAADSVQWSAQPTAA